MLNILIIISASIFISLTTYASEFRCSVGQGMYRISNKKEVLVTRKYCYGHPVYGVVSHKCIKANKKCLAVIVYEATKKIKVNYKTNKTPFHQKCSINGGKTVFVNFKTESKKVETSICQFSDGSFISMYRN